MGPRRRAEEKPHQSGGTLILQNCTIARNSSDRSEGGGILNRGALIVTNCTIAGNVRYAGAAFAGAGIYDAGTARIRSSVVAGNLTLDVAPHRPDNLVGAFTTDGFNFIGAIEGSTGFAGSGSNDQNGNPSRACGSETRTAAG